MALVRTDVSEERIASIIREKRISDLATTLAVTRNWNTLRRNTHIVSVSWQHDSVVSLPILITAMVESISSSKNSVLTRAIRRLIPEDGIFQRPSKVRFFCN
jgi:hypothetical protein